MFPFINLGYRCNFYVMFEIIAQFLVQTRPSIRSWNQYNQLRTSASVPLENTRRTTSARHEMLVISLYFNLQNRLWSQMSWLPIFTIANISLNDGTSLLFSPSLEKISSTNYSRYYWELRTNLDWKDSVLVNFTTSESWKINCHGNNKKFQLNFSSMFFKRKPPLSRLSSWSQS